MSSFRELANQAERKLIELRRAKPVSITSKTDLRDVPGVYAISNGKSVLYVGLSKKLKQRFRQHTNGQHYQSMFTIKIARDIYRKQTGDKSTSQTKLYESKKYKKAYELAAKRVQKMKVRFVEVDDARLRIVLEVCAGMAFKTKWNNFNAEQIALGKTKA
jgi:predicted GIY-YIG superfamily endonuclease